ncbi:Ser-Thr-rich glycosyl-phosphatidyl-inositol-anchored membrane family protein [compost metagenome]
MLHYYTSICAGLLCLGLLSAPAYGKIQKFHADPVSRQISAPITKELSSYRVFSQDRSAIQSFITNIRGRYNDPSFSTTITIPMLDGKDEDFVISSSNMLPESFQQAHPDILAFKGVSADGQKTLRLTLTPLGMMGTIRIAGVEGAIYLAPVDLQQPDNLIIYSAKDMQQHVAAAKCGTDGSLYSSEPDLHLMTAYLGSSQMRNYRLAVAATGEYTAWATSQAAALALITTSVNNISAIYERDASIHFTLVTNNSVIYPDATIDPYTTVSFPSGTTLTENNTALNTNITSANYDVGILFGYGWSGGLAQLSATCGSSKGRGAGGLNSGFSSGSSGPVFDNMIAHEIGHQFSAQHTMASNNGGCSGNTNPATGWEPGGGSTIMAYAGTCSGNAYQTNSDDYFHGGSLGQIATFITSGAGAGCATLSSSGNTTPISTVAASSYSIPNGTPFKLTLNTTDANASDVLSYTWEQIDAIGGTGTSTAPSATATSGPQFRSFPPGTSATRYLPSLSVLLGNASGTYEVLPTVARTMNFRGTARDNHSGGGAAAYADVAVTTLACGPFAFTNLNTTTSLVANGSNTVTLNWNTATACAAMPNIKISFSTDGGQTFPYTILASTANDGTETITVPNLPTCSGRFMIESIGNIYFNINSADVSITSACASNGAQFVPTTSLSTPVGDASLNMTLTPTYGTTITSPITGSITSGSTAGNLSFYNPNTPACQGPSNSNRYNLIEFYPSVSGTYTFNRTTSGNIVVNLFEGAYNSASVCDNFLASSANMNGTNDGVIIGTSTSASLCANQKYVLQVSTFNNSVTLPNNFSINVVPPAGGAISTGIANPAGTNYMYIIVNNTTGNIVLITSSVNMTNTGIFPIGNYTVYGLSSTSTATALNTSYAGTSFNSFNTALLNQTAGVCGQLSANARTVAVTAPLPVTLMSFKASKTVSGDALLDWKVKEDAMTAGYTIERSLDGQYFTQIDYVAAKGDQLNAEQAYQYTDKQFAALNGKVYYRLRMEHKDQSLKYSDIAMLQNGEANNNISIFPNPVNHDLFVHFNNDAAAVYHISITDVLGKTVWQQDYQKVSGANNLSIPVSAYASGMYYISITDGTEISTHKFIKK